MIRFKPLFLAILVLSPLLLVALCDNTYYVHGLACRVLVFTVLLVALDLVMGYIGDVSVAHVAFFALGAYSVAICTATPEMNSASETTMRFFPQLSAPLAVIVDSNSTRIGSDLDLGGLKTELG